MYACITETCICLHPHTHVKTYMRLLRDQEHSNVLVYSPFSVCIGAWASTLSESARFVIMNVCLESESVRFECMIQSLWLLEASYVSVHLHCRHTNMPFVAYVCHELAASEGARHNALRTFACVRQPPPRSHPVCACLSRVLHSNQITTLPADVFQGLTSLQYLWVVACGWRLAMHVGRVCDGRQCVYCKLSTRQMAASTYAGCCAWHVAGNACM